MVCVFSDGCLPCEYRSIPWLLLLSLDRRWPSSEQLPWAHSENPCCRRRSHLTAISSGFTCFPEIAMNFILFKPLFFWRASVVAV